MSHYRREIDGLRAMALMPVMLYHAGFQSFQGGFVGVDVFFVISGYLITSLIVAELKAGTFSLLHFWVRRVRRIIPVLFLVTIVTIPAAWTLFSPSDLNTFNKSLVTIPLFISNFFFWKDSNYFEPASEISPLLHTWSLAIEEQFYFFYPLAVILCWRLRRNSMIFLVSLSLIASLILAQLGSIWKPGATFFLLPTRLWELLIGAFLALYISEKGRLQYSIFYSQSFSILGLGMVLGSVWFFGDATPHPSLLTILPTLGTALIIAFGVKGTLVWLLLSNRYLVGIGLISYSAYLWHQPLLAFARYAFPLINSAEIFIILVITIGISVLTYKYVESPFRAVGKLTNLFVLSLAFTLGMLIVLFGTITSKIEIQVEDKMAFLLSKDIPVYSGNIDERIFAKYRVKYETRNLDSLILGSSRVLQIDESVLGKEALNLAVSGASLEDLIGIWQISKVDLNFKTLYVGLDPWLLNTESENSRWKSIADEYSFGVYELGLSALMPNTAEKDLPSPLNSFFENLYTKLNNQRYLIASDLAPSYRDKLRPDGSRVYNLAYTNQSAELSKKSVNETLGYGGMRNFSKSADRTSDFLVFLKELNSRYELILVLSPFHPNVYDAMKINYREYLEIEDDFRSQASSVGIQVVGSFNPYPFNCSKSDFYDGMHPKRNCMVKVFEYQK